jgi:pyridoxine 5-phosphate synthase
MLKVTKKIFLVIIFKLKKAGIVVSLFIDADLEQVSACSEVGADAVELNTGKYSLLFKESGSSSSECKGELKRIAEVSKEALKRKLIVNAPDTDLITRV